MNKKVKQIINWGAAFFYNQFVSGLLNDKMAVITI